MAVMLGSLALHALLLVFRFSAAIGGTVHDHVVSTSHPVDNWTVPETSLPTTTADQHREVCYDHVCFNNRPPFDNANMLLPDPPAVVGTRFLLYTRRDPQPNGTYFLDYRDAAAVAASRYDPALPTRLIIHGFGNSAATVWLYEMKDALLRKEPMNVVIVLWGPGAAMPAYSQAVANTRLVAAQTAALLRRMLDLGARPADIHLIGHSLGAHTAGLIGHQLTGEGLPVGRITGLDPAELDYEHHPILVRLDRADADFVDVIHTNGAPMGRGGAGLIQPCGHVDFYVNGGERQPDCPNQVSGTLAHLGDLLTGNTESIENLISCSHSRSHDLFTESVNSLCPFTSYPCASYSKFQRGECLSCDSTGCGTLGYYADWYEARGKMFLNTRLGKPFCGHHYGVTVRTGDGQKDTDGRLSVQLNGTWGVSEWIVATSTDADKLHSGAMHGKVGVAAEMVGEIGSVNVRYDKARFNIMHYWGRGQNTWTMDYMTVVSGENGKMSTFCIDRPLRSGVAATGLKSTTDHC